MRDVLPARLEIVHASPQLLSGYYTEASERVAYDAKDRRVRYQEALSERREMPDCGPTK